MKEDREGAMVPNTLILCSDSVIHRLGTDAWCWSQETKDIENEDWTVWAEFCKPLSRTRWFGHR